MVALLKLIGCISLLYGIYGTSDYFYISLNDNIFVDTAFLLRAIVIFLFILRLIYMD